jgi:hypothetical protein
MVKKIRVIEDTPVVEEMTETVFRSNMIELAKSADWKLWELLQTIQRLEKKIAVMNDDDNS